MQHIHQIGKRLKIYCNARQLQLNQTELGWDWSYEFWTHKTFKIYTEINGLLWLRTDIPESFPDVVTQTIEPKESGH